MIWTLATIASSLVFLAFSYYIFKKLSEQKNIYVNQISIARYIENTLVVEKTAAGNFNKVFKNTLDSKHMINQYIISYDSDTPYLICNFTSLLKATDILEICSYNAKGRLMHRVYVEDIEPSEKTPFISLPKNTVFVNIYFHEDKSSIVDTSEVHRNWAKAYMGFAKHESLALLFVLVPLGYWMLTQLGGDMVEDFKTLRTVFLGFVLMLITCGLNYLGLLLWMTLINRQRGGKSE